MLKNFLITLTMLMFLHITNAQNSSTVLPPAAPGIYEMHDTLITPPQFGENDQYLYRYLAKNVRYPRSARENDIHGEVVVTFVVDEIGRVTDLFALKRVGGGCTEEALRLISTMPNWQPGTLQGKPVKVRYTLPVKFSLN